MKKLDLAIPPRSDRIIGFTIPRNGSFYICDHDEVWSVAIGPSLKIEPTDHDPYRFVEQSRDFVGLVFDGLVANTPLTKVRESEISYDFDPKNDFATIRYSLAGQSGQIEFRTFSGDWFSASLSDDGRYLVLAEPYDIALYQIS